MKKFLATALFLFLFFGAIHGQKKYIKWKKLDSPEFTTPEIAGGKSKNDFWILDARGILFHFNGEKWIGFPIQTDEALSQLNIFKTGENSFLLAGIDNDWRTHIFHFENGKWKKDTLVIKNPATQIKASKENDIYLGGNWGTFYRYRNRRWTKIKVPFKNHLNIEIDKNGIIWLGVRGEGIFSYDGNVFKKYKIENDLKTDIYLRLDKDSSITFFPPNGNVYFKKDDEFVKRETRGQREDEVAFGYLSLRTAGMSEAVAVPLSLRAKNLKMLRDGSFLIPSEDNFIYASEFSENNFFEDISLAYKVEGHRNSKSTGAALIYFNDDILPDIFVFNSFAGEYSELYENKGARPFMEISGKIERLFSESSRLFTAGDLNGDLRTDFAIMNFGDDGSVVQTFFQKRDGFFEKGKTVFPPEGYKAKPFNNFRLFDFNEDGKTDIDVSTFFGRGMKKGNQLPLMNKGVAGPSEYDASFAAQTKGWTAQSIFADFNGDGKNDWLLVTEWEAPKLLLKTEDGFRSDPLPVDSSAATLGALAFDYDNDGDLDLLATSDEKLISVFNNNSKGVFTDRTDELKLNYINSKQNNVKINRSFTSGDFNNDGYVDFFFSYAEPGNKRNYLFMNDSGKAFFERSEAYSVARPYAAGAVAGDIDGDGDLDVYGFREGFNTLWVNNLNDKNYLAIIPRGVISNGDAIGAKISIFTAEKNFDRNALLGFRQIGAGQFGRNMINQRLAHFGVSGGERLDVRIEFYGGKTVELKNVGAGKTIEVFELTGLSAGLYLLPGKILRFASSTENQFYILIVIAAFFILIFGVRQGVGKYRWSAATAAAIILVNISIFWLMIFLSLNTESYFTKYALPLIVITFGLLLPHFIFFTISKNPFLGKSKKEAEENLLRKLMLFTHGEWALRNLSGLQLLTENFPAEKENLQNYFELLNKRKKTFFETTLPLINEIAETLNYLGGSDRKTAAALAKEIKSLRETLENETLSEKNAEELKTGRASFSFIKTAIKDVKEKIFKKFSCDPVEVVKNVADEYEARADKENVELKKYRDYDSDVKALITASDLGVALDNCLQNSFRAVAGKENAAVQIIVKRTPPKITIEISDNGTGIDENILDKIFEHGFSGSGSGGSGLYISKSLLEKYNGRIFIKETAPEKGTTISIELNEGM